MPLIAQFAADAATFSVRGSDGSATGFEVPWHRAVLTVEDDAGKVVRSAEVFVDGRLDVRGEGEAAHGPAQAEPAAAPASDMAGQGFAALNPAIEPEAGQGEVKP